MSFTKREMNVKSTDGIHTLSGVIYVPDGEIKGIFHLVHGMTEYIGRYDRLMSDIANNGFVCFGYDNLGHGRTARDDSELGFIAHSNGWKHLADDTNAFESEVRSLYPDKRMIVMGHSMGSFIVRTAAEKYGNAYDRLIICGTGGPNPAAGFGLILTDIIKTLCGEKHISNTVNSIAFGAYNKKFEHISKYDWITKDRDVIAKYEADKYCTFSFTVSAMHDLVKLNSVCNRRKWFFNMRKDLPVLIISGSDDPVGGYGKGVTRVYKKLKSAGLYDVTLKLYNDCRHEIHNDTCRDEVTKDILEFINR